MHPSLPTEMKGEPRVRRQLVPCLGLVVRTYPLPYPSLLVHHTKSPATAAAAPSPLSATAPSPSDHLAVSTILRRSVRPLTLARFTDTPGLLSPALDPSIKKRGATSPPHVPSSSHQHPSGHLEWYHHSGCRGWLLALIHDCLRPLRKVRRFHRQSVVLRPASSSSSPWHTHAPVVVSGGDVAAGLDGHLLEGEMYGHPRQDRPTRVPVS